MIALLLALSVGAQEKQLRPAVNAGKFGPLNPNLLSHIYGFDAAGQRFVDPVTPVTR